MIGKFGFGKPKKKEKEKKRNFIYFFDIFFSLVPFFIFFWVESK